MAVVKYEKRVWLKLECKERKWCCCELLTDFVRRATFLYRMRKLEYVPTELIKYPDVQLTFAVLR